MPNANKPSDVSSPWGDLHFEAVNAPSPPEDGERGEPSPKHAAPARTSSGRARASRAAQFMPFAALTGYYDLIREQEVKAASKYGQNQD